MGDWRHFGDRLELVAVSRECALLPDIPPPSGRPRAEMFGALHAHLARVIEGEILPRLMLAYGETRGEHPGDEVPDAAPVPVRVPIERRPTSDEIARFSALLLDRSGADVTPRVLTLLDEGMSLETLLLDLLTPAARHLGRLWEEDDCDFVDVTLAIGRLQATMRDLCARLEDESLPRLGRSILLVPCPGETHLFGLMMVASFFREAGWDVTTADGEPGFDLCALVRDEWFDVIGLSLSCEVLLPALTEAVRDLRRASRNPSVRVLVGGAHFARVPEAVRLVGAEASAEDGRIAPLVAESLLEMRARAC